ncbi:MAG TPA: hypothetical protein VLK33_21800, partial [Terriglobales bacterium]|nr:hypothetical protein [Terriglobales bacterium]
LQAYKEKWGGISQPLYYTYLGIDAKMGGVQRDSSMVKWVSQMLSRMPLPLFAQLSPLLFRRVV